MTDLEGKFGRVPSYVRRFVIVIDSVDWLTKIMACSDWSKPTYTVKTENILRRNAPNIFHVYLVKYLIKLARKRRLNCEQFYFP